MINFRDFRKLNFPNDGSRSLLESVIAPEIINAIGDWKKHANTGVLIGGLALSYWAKPRYTTDVDMIFLTKSDIPSNVDGFKAHRAGAFEHKETGVEIEVLYPGYIPVPQHVFVAVFDTAVCTIDGLKVASKEGIIALKLYRYELQDQADIQSLVNLGAIDLSKFKLDGKGLTNLIHWNKHNKVKLKS